MYVWYINGNMTGVVVDGGHGKALIYGIRIRIRHGVDCLMRTIQYLGMTNHQSA